MSAIRDLVDRIEKEMKEAKEDLAAAKNNMVAIARVVNRALRNMGAAGSADSRTEARAEAAEIMKEAKKQRKSYRRHRYGKHRIWHNRLSGQYLYPDGTKACSNCFKLKLATTDYFRQANKTPTKLQSWCIACMDNPFDVVVKRRAANIDGTPARPLKPPKNGAVRWGARSALAASVIRRHSVDGGRK